MLPSSSLFAVKEQTLSRFIAILCIVTLVSHKVLLNVEHNRNHGAAYHEQQLQSSLPQQQRQQQQQQPKQEAVSGTTGGQQQTSNEIPPRREQDVLLSRSDRADYMNTMLRKNAQAMMNNATTVGSSSINEKKKTTTTNQQQMKNSSSTHAPLLDFVIAGFPKCGTSTLLYSLASHSETIMAPRERCDATKNNITDQAARELLHRALGSAAMSAAEESAVTARQRKYQRHNELEPEEPSSSGAVAPVTRRGFKCPIIMKNTRSIERILRLSPGTKFVVGVRHPIGMMQSYYNYRVKEIYDHLLAEQQQPQQPGEIRKLALKEYIPPFDAIVNGTISSWKGVSRNVTQFDKSLRQLGKLTNLIQPPPSSKNGTAAVPPQEQPGARARSGPRLFLYSLEQMQDGNTARKSIFRRELQQFLGLQKLIPPFGYDNPGNSRVPHDESIDICSERYSKLRQELAVQGRRAANWIIHQLLLQQDNSNNGNIVVPNQDHFVSTLRRWGTDPCVIRNNNKKKTPPSPAKTSTNSSAPPAGAVVAAAKEG